MPSSPAEQRLARISDAYNQALEAILRDDIERVESLLQLCEQDLIGLQDAARDNVVEQGLRDQAITAYGRLLDALKQARTVTLGELEKIQIGKQLLARYGGRSDPTGTNVSSDV